MDIDSRRQALKRAIEIKGGQLQLAVSIGTTQSQIWYWLTKAKKGVPGDYVLKIEAETGVSRHEQRPDIFPPAEVQP